MNRLAVDFMDSTAASIFAELDDANRGRSLVAAVCARDAALRSRAVGALRSDGVDVCTATTGPAELLAELTRYHVDCVVCIASGADGDGDMACAQALRSRPSGSRLVVVSHGVSRTGLRRLLDMGVHAFVLESQIATALGPAVRAACSRLVAVPAELSQNVERRPLTGRQREVLRLAALGSGNAEIAELLYVSESTVKSHLSAAFAKIGVTSRVEARALMLDPEVAREVGISDIR